MKTLRGYDSLAGSSRNRFGHTTGMKSKVQTLTEATVDDAATALGLIMGRV